MTNAPEATPGKQGAPQVPTPFYNRPFFWALLIFLIGAATGGLFFQQKTVVVDSTPTAPVAPVTPAAPTPPVTPETPQDNSNAVVESIIAGQRARNDSLQTELDRLKALLNAEPCQVREALGLSPSAVPLPGRASDPANPITNKGEATLVRPNADAGNTVPAKSAAPSPRTVGDLMEQSTVFIISLTDEKAQTGTGFFVAPGVIATNRHVVGSPNAKILVINKVLGEVCGAQILAVSQTESRDYALLRLINPEKAKLAPVLKMTADVHRTDKVSAWGFPGAVTADDPKFKALMKGDVQAAPEVVYSEGVVSVVLQQHPAIIVHTALISQGNSGGPLVNEQGAVVGINTMIALDSKSYRQSGLSLASNDLMAFLSESGVSPVIAQPTPAP